VTAAGAPTLDQVVAGAGELASLPDSWQHIDAVLAKPSSNNVQIADAIARDPGLTARLLRLANSPMFGLSSRVERLSQAVHLIGTRQLRELALAATVVDLISAGPGKKERIQAFLHHSTATGLFARAIAGRRRETDVERFFVAGLLHDLGLLVLETAAPDLLAEATRQATHRNKPIEVGEKAVFGFDHAAVGAALMKRWRLPDALSEPVAWHHDPSSAPTHPVESAAVHLGSTAVDLIGLGGEGCISTPLDPRAWTLLAFEPADLTGMVEQVAANLAPMLDILIGESPA
jgi:putative nucleotidyltransferase with HDIG domain